MIMAKLRNGNNRARYFEFLVDTGADFTLISRYDAQLLGLVYNKMKQKEIKVEVADLTFIRAKKVSLVMSIEGHDFKIPVLVAKKSVESLIGRKGLFDNFDVIFKEREQQIVFVNVHSLD